MKRIIIRKENNVITKEEIGKERYQKQKGKDIEEKMFDFLELKENDNNKKEKQMVLYMFRTIRTRRDYKIINHIYTELQKVDNKESLEKLFEFALDNLYDSKMKKSTYENKQIVNTIRKSYQQKKDYMLNVFSTQAIMEYFNMIAQKMNMDSIKTLEALILKDENTDKIMDCLNKKYTEEEKKGQLYQIAKESFKQAINKKYFGNGNHLCWNCATPIVKCPKILDVRKKHISEYNFITAGEQIYRVHNEESNERYGEMEAFTVEKCLKFTR